MEFIYADGGRSQYFKATNVGDCATRAICNATGKDYKEVYNALRNLTKEMRNKQRKGSRAIGGTVRDGADKRVCGKYITEVLGWTWHSTSGIGQRTKVHLNDYELPNNEIMIVQVSRHLTCVKNGVLYDTYDCTREGERMVYGYYTINK